MVQRPNRLVTINDLLYYRVSEHGSKAMAFLYITHFMSCNSNASVKRYESENRADANMARKRSKRKKKLARKPRRRKTSRKETEVHNRALIAILALLYILHLINEKTYDGLTSSLNPAKTRRRGKKRRRRIRRRT